MTDQPRYPTSLGTSSATEIHLLGHDLAEDLMGTVGFGELAFWLVAMRRPSAGEVRVFESVLVALTDHGFTPTAIAARLTDLSAPGALQGAVAAGILGGGSRYLGVTEDTGIFLAQILTEAAQPLPDTEAGWDELAATALRAQRAAGAKVPGLGHPVHKQGDPRTPRLIAIADEEGLHGPHLRLFEALGRMSEPVLGRALPLNGAGVCGAALADLGLPVEMLRGFALLARTAGLLGQIAEERRNPIAPAIYAAVDRNAVYVPPLEPDVP
ncbi:citryl-CoA lyase [Occultella aeris]|uniref:citrate synthase (unknown stereospecificity) n=1 Tax=Occultella aeris TaxID=2761496 RepID=A0A7M4DGY8_9MICO|nr:citryl-CoA lyase [Occultella aeris]VZO36181.1 Citrate synthase 2 [Occultella aeris]